MRTLRYAFGKRTKKDVKLPEGQRAQILSSFHPFKVTYLIHDQAEREKEEADEMDRYREGVNLRIGDQGHTPPDPPSLGGTLAPG